MGILTANMQKQIQQQKKTPASQVDKQKQQQKKTPANQVDKQIQEQKKTPASQVHLTDTYSSRRKFQLAR